MLYIDATEDKTIIYKGETLTLAEVIKRTGLSEATIRTRFQKEWSPEAIVETPERTNWKERTIPYQGREITLAEAVQITGLPESTIRNRHYQKWSPEDLMKTE